VDKNFERIKELLPSIQENVLLANHTTYKIGGPAKYFFVAKTKQDLITALTVAKKFKLPIYILGGGSNVLISEKGFDGLVIKVQNTEHRIYDLKKIYVEAGVNITKIAYLSADIGLSGLEWSVGMPGTIGGAIYGSAQAFGARISDIVESVEVVDEKTMKIRNLAKKQCKFSLKNSIFKANNTPRGANNLVIISAVLDFSQKPTEQIKSKIKEFLEYRKTKHPMEFPSAGSVFINPEKVSKEILEKYPELDYFFKKGPLPAGYLIAKCGLAGKKIGNAQISEKHANFIINLGEATAEDVLALINLAQSEVKKTFGIELEPEVQIL